MEDPEPEDYKKILLDADVIRHFLRGGIISNLAKIYPNRLVIVDVVEYELCRSKSLIIPVKDFITQSRIERLSFPNSPEIRREYAWLQKEGYGPGESACMAVARFDDQMIASSNLKDIRHYCTENGIKYLTTMDILLDAISKGIMTEIECNALIAAVLSTNGKLPTSTIKEYKEKFKE